MLLTCSQSLNFKLGSDEFCMRFYGGATYTLEYVVSGN